MFDTLLAKVFGTKHERDVKQLRPIVDEINEWAEEFRGLTDDQFTEKTAKFRQRLAEGETLDDLLPEAYGLVKEACRRMVGKSWEVRGQMVTWGMVPYDVQLMGGIVLHEGKITEMATGEGKTLVAIMPLYLNALTGRGVHLVTVNDYLANRDREWMGPIYEFLGLTVDCLQTNDYDITRKQHAYNADVTYGTVNEFGFDYLRDNMKLRLEDRVQRDYYYAIVDEVDSILIDEARTPLIIAGEVHESRSEKYAELRPEVERLVRAQIRLVSKLISEAEELLKDDENQYEAGIQLLQAQRGTPKNKRLLKLQQEQGIKKLISQVEADFLRDKRMTELDDELYYTIDEKGRNIEINEKGRELLSPDDQQLFVLPDLGDEMHRLDADETLTVAEKNRLKVELEALYADRSERIHNLTQLILAYSLYERDVDYVVENGKVVIVDEFTGRLMYGRRWADGLHQAVEAKEGVKIEQETQTVATITIQNYFRMYEKLAGMTGTAETEAAEFYQIYKLDVVVVPTNQPVRRIDYEDVIYRTRREKYNSVLDEIEEMHKQGRPVLVGTTSVDASETLSRMLTRRGIKHTVLNAKFHQQEAGIIAGAGQAGAVTIATNMAGRGTDIKLGLGVVKCEHCHLNNGEPLNTPTAADLTLKDCYENVPCGLHIIGTERHDARRIDRQLRGRSARQGDPGSSRFYLSLEDNLMRLFGSERIASVMDRLGIQEGEVIEHPLVTRSIERAQKRVEAHNFDMRKHLLEYDDVMNQQREAVYDRRLHALEGNDLRNEIMEMIDSVASIKVDQYTGSKKYPEEWDLDGLSVDFLRNFHVAFHVGKDELETLTLDSLREMVHTAMVGTYERKESVLTPEVMRQLERYATLRVIDERWQEHLYEMDHLKEGIGLRAYGQVDPLVAYKKEAYAMFEELWDRLDEEILSLIYKAEVTEVEPSRRRMPSRIQLIHQEAPIAGPAGLPAGDDGEDGQAVAQEQSQVKKQPIRVEKKVGRNDPCPCGSGKKYKKCHGAATTA